MPAFLLPDLGEGLTEAEIVAWHVRAGDTVTVDQRVAEVETAKAVVEVPVPFAGRVTELHGTVGDVVAVGSTADHGRGRAGRVPARRGTPEAENAEVEGRLKRRGRRGRPRCEGRLKRRERGEHLSREGRLRRGERRNA